MITWNFIFINFLFSFDFFFLLKILVKSVCVSVRAIINVWLRRTQQKDEEESNTNNMGEQAYLNLKQD